MGYRTCASESNRHGRCRSSQVEGGLFWKSGQNVGSRGGPKGKGERERRRKRGGCTAKRGNETPSPDSENSRSYRAAERIILSLLRVTTDYRLVVIQSPITLLRSSNKMSTAPKDFCEGCTCGRAEGGGLAAPEQYEAQAREQRSFTAPIDLTPSEGIEPAVPLRSNMWFNNPEDGTWTSSAV